MMICAGPTCRISGASTYWLSGTSFSSSGGANPAEGPGADFQRGLTSLGRFGEPSEIANAVVFLASPAASAETVDTHVVPLGNGLFAVSWKERTGATVTHVQDFDRGVIHSHATLPDGQFLRMTGPITVLKAGDRACDDRPAHNKALVLKAMISLFQRFDASVVERLYAADYIQHNPTIPHGRAALKALVEGLSTEVYYEPGLSLAEGALAIHGRIRGWGPAPLVVVDLFRVEGGKLAEHWDVAQEEGPAAAGQAGAAMFEPTEAP